MRRKQDRDRVVNALVCNLQELKARHDELTIAVECGQMRLQILAESISDLQHVARFKQSMERALDMLDEDASMGTAPEEEQEEEAGEEVEQQQQQQPCGGGSNSNSETGQLLGLAPSNPSYVVGLLQNVEPALVQELLGWRAVDWHRRLNDAAFSICLLLQLTARHTTAGTAPPYNAVAEQELFKAVDDIVTVGALGTVFVQVTGKEVGVCTSLNHITMQQEAPPQDHWQHVLQQLHLSRPQLLKLAACYQEFTRQRKAQQALHAELAKAVACDSSCSLQLAAACAELDGATRSPSSGSCVGAAAAARARCSPDPGAAGAGHDPGAADDPRTAVAGASAEPGAHEEAVVLAEGDLEQGGAAPDPSVLMTRLLVMVNHSLSMPFLVLHNTLSRKQIACMLVASYPFVPRAGPIMEAAAQFLNAQLMRSGPDTADGAGEQAQQG